jgi:hypothetical protein
VLTHFIVASDADRTRRFYAGVLNIRVAGIHAVYERWRARAAVREGPGPHWRYGH